ncbi:MAG: alpha/beta hydrolase [Acidobacteriota bacterium]
MSKDEERTSKLLKVGLPMLAAAGTMGALGFARERFQDKRLFSPEAQGVLQGAKGKDQGQEQPEAPPETPPETPLFRPQDQWFETVDRVSLHGWWIPHSQARCTVLYCHGKNGSLGQWIEALAHLHGIGTSILAFDYRGYGYSEGKPSESGVFRDVRAAFDHLVGPLGVSAETVILFGHSLGGAVAIDAARSVPAAGLVVESTFTDLRAMARSRYPKAPVHWLTRNQFKNLSKVRTLRLPKLFLHGTEDEMVPLSMSEQLYSRAREPKRFFAVEGAGHNDLHRRGGLPYEQTLANFFADCVSDSASDSASD